MNKKKSLFSPKLFLCALAFSGLFTLLAGSGLLKKADLSVADALYQSARATDGTIVLINIDQRALEEIGPYNQWGRDTMARILEALNVSEDCRPAVIGIDVLYTGSSREEADQWLAQAAGEYGNVVTACLAEYGPTLAETDDGEFYLDPNAVVDFSEPYPALKESTSQGHVNAMLDTDGILRHHLLSVTLPDGTLVPSMALAVAEKYRKSRGEEPVVLPPADSRGFWYLPYCGLPGAFSESISAADLLSGARDPRYFHDKIVLIGPYAPGLQDNYLTSIDHAGPMYGVEFQANAIQALLWGDNYKQEADETLQLLLLSAVLFLSVWGFWKRPVRFSTALWIFLCAGYVLLCRWLYGLGWVLHILWLPLGVTLLYAGCLAFNYVQAALEKRKVTNRFKKYVAPQIVNEILKEGTASLKLGGNLTQIAVLFVDVRGFTSMSEKLGPTLLVDVLNRYLALISDCILKNGGTLDKFIGDAAMAFWGAPLPQKDYIMNAVRAAADMVSGSAALARELKTLYNRSVSFGIGIHVGPAVVGNIGSPQRMDYTAIGDTVNTAERLESKATGGDIYLSRAVVEALENRISVEFLGKIALKGKADDFEVFRLKEIRPVPEDKPAGLNPH